MNTIKEKRKYEKPAMQVYELRQQASLLTGSPTTTSMDATLEEEDWVVTP